MALPASQDRLRAGRNAGLALGVFLFGAPKESASDAGRSWQVELLGKLAILDSASTEATLTVPAGSNLVQSAVDLAQNAGESRIAATPSPATTSSAMMWDPGTSTLTVINELLAAAGYWSAWADGSGVVRFEPYSRPAQRPSSFSFVEGDAAIHSAEWTRDQDLASVPNRVVLVGQGSDETPALVGIATNEDPASPFSFQRRGRWITHSETGVEAANQETLTGLARRKLINSSTPQATLQVTHMPIPIMPNDAGTFRSQGHTSRVVLRSVQYDLDPTALCNSTLVEVVDL